MNCVARSLREPKAFELIFERHFGSVHRYLHRRAGRDLADELAAETFALAFEGRASCRASGSVLPWLYGIAYQRAPSPPASRAASTTDLRSHRIRPVGRLRGRSGGTSPPNTLRDPPGLFGLSSGDTVAGLRDAISRG